MFRETGKRMIHQALYRVWRPRDFDDMVGQEHIRRTLTNALMMNSISHAYLFTGPKGTGKTSAARILAKALNCSDREGSKPCGLCESCVSITRGNALDVIEIDAASNRGVDDARDLREKINFLPVIGKYKVYIIDEAHMLTVEAFNTLLKTLEEPPEHVIFILATTDHSRMPATILSRCQRFDFRKLSADALEKRLRDILDGLNRQAEPEALSIIARQADGSARDAISMLDQCLSYNEAILSGDDVCEVLGIARRETLSSMVNAVIEGDANALFDEINNLFAGGIDPALLIREFAGYCRDLLLMAICGYQTELAPTAGGSGKRMIAQCEALGAGSLRSILAQAERAMGDGRYRGVSSYMAEAFFAGLLLDRARGGNQSQAQAEGEALSSAHQTRARQSRTPQSQAPGNQARPNQTPPGQAPSSQAPSSQASPGQAPPNQASPSQTRVAAPIVPSPKELAKSSPIDSAGSSPASPFMPYTAASEASEPADVRRSGSGDALSGLSAAQWTQILQLTRSRKVTLHAFMSGSAKQELYDGVLRLFFDQDKGSFHKKNCEDPDNLAIIGAVATEVLGAPVKIECGFISEESAADPIGKAIALFGKDIVKIE